MTSGAARTPHRAALLAQQLTTLLGEAAPAAMAFLHQHLQWLELAGGEVLMEQGAPGDSAYLCVSGQLRVYSISRARLSARIRPVTSTGCR